MDLTALLSELQTDPAALGYNLASADQTLADMLNAARGTTWRGVIPSHEIVSATDPAEWAALSAAEKQRYQTLTGAGSVDVSNANVRAALAAMFGPGTATRPALVALAQRSQSRAEELFGDGTKATHLDIAAARRLV